MSYCVLICQYILYSDFDTTTPEIIIIKMLPHVRSKNIAYYIQCMYIDHKINLALILCGFIHNSISVFLVCGSVVAKANISHVVRGLCYR